jgi:hypothetical protein
LQVKNIPYTIYDLASDEDAKRLWRRKAPTGEREFIPEFKWFGSSGGHSDKQQLPGILVGGKFPGVSAIYFFSISIDKPIH